MKMILSHMDWPECIETLRDNQIDLEKRITRIELEQKKKATQT